LRYEFSLRGTELYCIMSSVKQPKEKQTKATSKEKVTSDHSEVCIELFFACLFFFLFILIVISFCHNAIFIEEATALVVTYCKTGWCFT